VLVRDAVRQVHDVEVVLDRVQEGVAVSGRPAVKTIRGGPAAGRTGAKNASETGMGKERQTRDDRIGRGRDERVEADDAVEVRGVGVAQVAQALLEVGVAGAPGRGSGSVR
jgi:hypothetical protein